VCGDEQRHRIAAAGTRVIPKARLVRRRDEPDPTNAQIGRIQLAEVTGDGWRRLVYAGLVDKRSDPFGPPRLEGVRREAHG